MWISNTATTLMLLPVAMAIIERARGEALAVQSHLLLGITGLARRQRTGGYRHAHRHDPPNLIFMQIYTETTGGEVSFGQWISWGLPVVLVMVPLMGTVADPQACAVPARWTCRKPGAWRLEEKRVMMVFALTALAWVTRTENIFPFGGWRAWLDLPTGQRCLGGDAGGGADVHDSQRQGRTPAELGAGGDHTVPWGVLILFSGGICLAKGFVASGLSPACWASGWPHSNTCQSGC